MEATNNKDLFKLDWNKEAKKKGVEGGLEDYEEVPGETLGVT